MKFVNEKTLSGSKKLRARFNELVSDKEVSEKQIKDLSQDNEALKKSNSEKTALIQSLKAEIAEIKSLQGIEGVKEDIAQIKELLTGENYPFLSTDIQTIKKAVEGLIDADRDEKRASAFQEENKQL